MYYDASGTDYISTPSFAIPNTGILTIETWMKSVLNAGTHQAIMGDAGYIATSGFIQIIRYMNDNVLDFRYANGTSVPIIQFNSFFQGLDNQYIHIEDYMN